MCGIILPSHRQLGFDQGRTCLACGEVEPETKPEVSPAEHQPLDVKEDFQNECRHPDKEIDLARSAYLLVIENNLYLCKDTLATFERICSNHSFALPEVLKWIPGRPEWDIFICLASGAHFQATDPRDKIFALLSLMEPRARAMIPLNYSLSVRCVETFALTAIIVVTGSL